MGHDHEKISFISKSRANKEDPEKICQITIHYEGQFLNPLNRQPQILLSTNHIIAPCRPRQGKVNNAQKLRSCETSTNHVINSAHKFWIQMWVQKWLRKIRSHTDNVYMVMIKERGGRVKTQKKHENSSAAGQSDWCFGLQKNEFQRRRSMNVR